MNQFRRLHKPVSLVVVLGLLSLTLSAPAAHAAMIGTDAAFHSASSQVDRDRIVNLVQREEVKQRLAVYGVDPVDVERRVASLSDAEIETLATRIDQLPAGGDGLGVIVFLFLVLLITDILGLTNVFPFVNKPVRR